MVRTKYIQKSYNDTISNKNYLSTQKKIKREIIKLYYHVFNLGFYQVFITF